MQALSYCTLSPSQVFIYALLLWIFAALLICRQAVLQRPPLSMRWIHCLVWSVVLLLLLWHGVAHAVVPGGEIQLVGVLGGGN